MWASFFLSGFSGRVYKIDPFALKFIPRNDIISFGAIEIKWMQPYELV